MLNRLIALLRGDLEAVASENGPFERRHIAVAALLLEAMYVDRRATEREHSAVTRLLRQHFDLPEAIVDDLVGVAEQRYAEVLDDWGFAEAVRVGFDAVERRDILALLWEVAYADGSFARLEHRLLGRLARDLELGDVAVEQARATAASRGEVIGRAGDE